MIKQITCTIMLLSFCCHIFSMFRPRVAIDNRNNNLAKLAEMIANQLVEQPVIEQQLPTSNKKVDFNVYKNKKNILLILLMK